MAFLLLLAMIPGLFGLGSADQTELPSPACTSTFVTTVGDRPPTTYEPTWTITRFTATETAYTAVDCGGCNVLETISMIVDYQYPSGTPPVSVTVYNPPEPTTLTVAQCQNAAPASSKATLKRRKRRDSDSSCASLFFEAPSFTFGPTRTVWTTTTTHTNMMDCGTCNSLKITSIPLGVPPVAVFDETTTVEEPTTETVYSCKPLRTGPALQPVPVKKDAVPNEDERAPVDLAAHPTRQGEPLMTIGEAPPVRANRDFTDSGFARPTGFEIYYLTPKGVKSPTCTSSTYIDPIIPDSTLTRYPATVTSTRSVKCGTCAVEWSTAHVYFFAPVYTTATITAKTASTRQVFACSTTPAQ